MVAVHGVDFPLISLNHRHGDFACVDSRLQRLDLFLIAAFKNLEPRLRARQLRQFAVDLRRAAVEMIDTHRRGYFFQLLHRRIAGRLGNDQIRFCRGDGLNVDIGSADKFDVGIIEVDAGQHAAGPQKVATVRSRAAMARHGRYAKLNQWNGDIQIV